MPQAGAIRVLVVDDQMTMRSLVRSSLGEIGFKQVEEATDGQEALKMLPEKQPHLVISDFNMPNMDGLELLRIIRSDMRTRKTAFIMLTGRADADLVKRAMQFGVNNYIAKPFTTETLKKKIEAVFGALVE